MGPIENIIESGRLVCSRGAFGHAGKMDLTFSPGKEASSLGKGTMIVIQAGWRVVSVVIG